MKWNELGEMDCPIARSLSIFGDRWTLLIIRNAFMKTHRFDDFQKQLGITRHLLTERLNRLVGHGVLQKVLYQNAPKRYEYQLTESGLALYPVIMSITAWGNYWLNDEGKYPVLDYIHKECEHIINTSLSCLQCNKHISGNDISVQWTKK